MEKEQTEGDVMSHEHEYHEAVCVECGNDQVIVVKNESDECADCEHERRQHHMSKHECNGRDKVYITQTANKVYICSCNEFKEPEV